MAMLAEGGWQTKPCCVLVDRLPSDSFPLEHFSLSEDGDHQALYYQEPNQFRMQTPTGKLIIDEIKEMAVSEETSTKDLPDYESPKHRSLKMTTSLEDKSPRKQYSVIKSNSAPDLHSLLSSSSTSNAKNSMSSPKRNSVDLCYPLVKDDVLQSIGDDQMHSSSSAFESSCSSQLDAETNPESKRTYPKRKCAFYFSYGRPTKWEHSKPAKKLVNNASNKQASNSADDLEVEEEKSGQQESQKNLDKSESDTELWSNDIREDECAMCLADKNDEPYDVKSDANLDNNARDFSSVKDTSESNANTAVLSGEHSETRSFKGSFLSRQSSLDYHSDISSGADCLECHQEKVDEPSASNHHLQIRNIDDRVLNTTNQSNCASSTNDRAFGGKNCAAHASHMDQIRTTYSNELSVLGNCEALRQSVHFKKKNISSDSLTKVRRVGRYPNSIDNTVAGNSRKMSNLYSIVPQENKDYNRTVITIQRAAAIGKVKKFRRKRGHRKRLLTPPGKIQSLRGEPVLRVHQAAEEPQVTAILNPEPQPQSFQRNTTDQPKKKKLSALSVYTQINDGIIKYVCCKRFKKRSKTGGTMEYKFPKSEPGRPRKQSETKLNKEFLEAINQKELPGKTNVEENVEDVVEGVVHQMVDFVYKDSVNNTKDLDMTCENYKIKDLLQQFCEEFGFQWSEFDELGDPNQFCNILSVQDNHLDGSYSIPSCRRMYYRRKFSLKRPLEDYTENEDSQIAWNVKRRRKRMATKNVVKRFFTRSAARSLASSCDLQGLDAERLSSSQRDLEMIRPSVKSEGVVCGRKKMKQRLEERYKTLNNIKSAPVAEAESGDDAPLVVVVPQPVKKPTATEAKASSTSCTGGEPSDPHPTTKDPSPRNGQLADEQTTTRTPCDDAKESAGKSSSQKDIMEVVENLVKCAERRQGQESHTTSEERVKSSLINKNHLIVKQKCIVPPPKKNRDDVPRKLPFLLPKQVPSVVKRPKHIENKHFRSQKSNVLKIPTMQPKVYPPLLPRPPAPGPCSNPNANQQSLVVSVCAKPLNPPVVIPIRKEPNPLPSKPIHPLPVHPCLPRTDGNRNVAQKTKDQLFSRHMPEQPLDLRIKMEEAEEKTITSKMKVPVQFVIPQLKAKVNKPPSPPSLLMRSLEKPPLSKGPIHFDTSSVKERKASPCPQSTSPLLQSMKSLDLSQNETLRRKKEEESILRSLLLENPPDEAFGLTEKAEDHCVLPIPSPSSGPVITDVFSLTQKPSDSISPKLGCQTSPSESKVSSALEFPSSLMEKLTNGDCDFYKEGKQMENMYSSDIPLSSTMSESDDGEWLKDPVAAREKINHLHKEILYLDMMAAQKEKERLLILHFRKYKEEVMKRVFRHTVRSQLREKSRLGIMSSSGGASRANQKDGATSVSNHTSMQSERSTSRSERHHTTGNTNTSEHSKTQNVFSPTALCSKEACLVRPMVVQDTRHHSRQSVGSFASIESLVAKSNDSSYSSSSSPSDKDAVLDLTSHRMPKSTSIFENTIVAHSRSSPVPGATVASARSHPGGHHVTFTPFTAIQQTNFLLNTLQGNGGAYTVHKGIDGDRSKSYREQISLPWPPSPAPSSSPTGNSLLSKSNQFRESAFARPHSASSNSSFSSSISPLAKDATSLSVDSKDLRVPSCGDHGSAVDRKPYSSHHHDTAGRIAATQSSRYSGSSLSDHHHYNHSQTVGAPYNPAIFSPVNGIASQLSPPGVHSPLSMGVPWWFTSSPDYLSKHDSRPTLSASDTRTIR